MVMILPEVPSFGKQFAQSLGRGVESGIGEGMHMGRQLALEKYKRGLDIQQKLAALGLSPDDYSNLGDQKPPLNQNGAVVNQTTPSTGATSPYAISPEEKKGETPSVARRLDTDEIREVVKDRVAQNLKRGIFVDPDVIRKQLEEENKSIESDIAFKAPYEKTASEILGKLLPNASEEMSSAFSRLATSLIKQGKTESQIRKELASEASKLAQVENNVKNIYKRQKGLPKILNYLSRTEKELPKQIIELKNNLKTVLDKGLYEEARRIAKEAGYGAEETELAIGNLSENAKKTIAKMPSFEKFEKRGAPPVNFLTKKITPEQYNEFESNLNDVLQDDPYANLILLRSDYMKKGVDWRSFNDAVNKIIDEKGINLTRKQQEELATVSQPPLSVLDQLLYDFGLRGK
jgi:hypothetical protein